METKTKKSKLVAILRGIARWYHDDRAYGCRLAVVNYHAASCGFVTKEAAEEYRHNADIFAEKARYHWKQARKYEGDKQ